MKIPTHLKCALHLGASSLVVSALAPAVLAQDSERKLDAVVVTTQKQAESIQDVPIAVSAFDESALEKLQLAGGPDLVKAIPNVNFTKGNFTGYNFRIRGIGVDAVSTSADNGVGVHMNDVPLTSNMLFEAEFYDVERVETLRGPQGTLYGRNATGGVVNVITAKPVLEEFQANVRLEAGNYSSFKGKGMVNLPIGETAALRLAGSFLSRDGYVDNLTTGNDIDDRNLYSLRGTFAWEPTDRLSLELMVEHFKEDDSRIRSGKQYCATDPVKTSSGGIPIHWIDQVVTSQGCVEADLNDPASLGGVNSVSTLGGQYGLLAGLIGNVDPATGNATGLNFNSNGIVPDLRQIESVFDPVYEAEQTLVSWRGDYDLTDTLTATYIGSYMEDDLISQEDYNETTPDLTFNTVAGPYVNLNAPATAAAFAALYPTLFPGGVVSDPQLGPQNTLAQSDISGRVSEQMTHELRLQSDFDGPFNFNVGAIKVDYEVNQGPALNESYYVFFNTSTAFNQLNNAASQLAGGPVVFPIENPANAGATPFDNLDGVSAQYFRSITPYTLDSFALFGEGYFDLRDNLQLTAGLRYTNDKKEVGRIPTFLSVPNVTGADPLQYQPIAGNDNDDAGDGTYNRQFKEVTGRIGVDWQPDLGFTEDTLLYAFYSRGYKGGGINPPQPAGASLFPQDFQPEFVDSYEIGTKNLLADGALQLNATGFYYNYEGYQITQIVNRSSVNFNVNAEITGFELEGVWSPVNNLVFTSNLGLLDAQVRDAHGIDVLDRTNGRSDLTVLKLFPGASNCVVSTAGYQTVLGAIQAGALAPGATLGLCTGAFAGQEAAFGLDGVTVSYTDSTGAARTATALQPFDGDAVNLDGNSLPGTPDTTFSLGAEYTFESVQDTDWNLILRGDYYYQAEAFGRIWNTGRDRLESWDNVNISAELANDVNGFAVTVFGKNITDEEVITGSYLTDDSSGLFTNVFLNEPATYGIAVSKRW